MSIQKLYKNGNSVAVTIPKAYLDELKLRAGSEVVVEKVPELESLTISVYKTKKTSKLSISPEFIGIAERFTQKYDSLLRKLAQA